MRDGWKRVSLDDVFVPTSDRLGSQEVEPRVFSISKHDGVVPADEYHGRRIASENLDTYKRLPDEGWAYSTIHIDEGSIARNTNGFDGVVSPMYTTMKWDSESNDPAFFEMLLRSSEMLTRYADSSQGSINRRRSLPWSTFSTMRVEVPPLPEQRRIVDLIGTLDEAIEAAVSNQNTFAAFGQARLSKAFSEADMAPVSDFADLIVGFPFKSASYADRGVRLLRGDNIVPGATRWDDAKRITPTDGVVQAKKYSLNVGDVVLAMDRPVISSGVKSARISSEDLPSQLVQRVARLRPKSREFARSIELCFSSREFESYLSSGQVGAHVPHINAQQINTFEVPTSMFLEDVAESFSATSDSATATSSYVSTLRNLRTNLLTSLLSGAHEIPVSYDDQLSEAV